MLTLSIPWLRPCAGEFQPLTQLGDREFVQLIAAFRLLLPDVGIVLSTREPARFATDCSSSRVTHASAGSHTEPGGYTGAGRDSIHQTVRGRIVELAAHSSEWAPSKAGRPMRPGSLKLPTTARLPKSPISFEAWDTNRSGRTGIPRSVPDPSPPHAL